ncbi:FKBP-type peptidyl-prolyl cis-trans isomerase [Flavobacterium daejeonense]|uniref:FKBP-type peptidyl-prolyl cis-trans isomerase n=1 Tax=Flavobacterium daejeonense TaxID=350893 RepID=UPI00047ACD06|nr:hypothetical protein [Flavobacterium daejeonense]
MNKFKYYFILIITSLALFSCSKDDNNSIEVVPPKDYAEQYVIEKATIEEYLETYTFVHTNAPGQPEDQDIVFTKITDPVNQRSIKSYLNSNTFPKLLSRDVKDDGITYKLYYLVLREGVGEKPCNVDEVFTSYNGKYLKEVDSNGVTSITSTLFEEVLYPRGFMGLFELIRGWKEIFPQFKTGTYVSNSDGTISYNDFGAGVMFIPSGLGYYNAEQGRIPSYSPLVFSFKLYEIKRSDIDGFIRFGNGANDYTVNPDKILSYQEDIDGDGYMWTKQELPEGAINPDDSDGDGVPDFLDVDDDNDGYVTKFEITVNGVVTPFASIPDCGGNTTNEARIKKHLDKNCH